MQLAKLTTQSYFFKAEDKESENFPDSLGRLKGDCLAYNKLELKIGAQVMLIKNMREKGLVNGSQGVVVDFIEEKQKKYPLVKFVDGQKLVIKEHTWEKIEGYDEKNNPIVSATRKQIPLILS